MLHSPTLTHGRKDRDKYFIYLGGDSSGWWLLVHPVPVWYHKLSPPASCIQTWYMDRLTMYLSLASHLASHHLHFTFAHCQPWGCGNLENVCCVVKAGGKEKCFNQNNYCLLRGAVSVCSSSAPPYLWPIDWKILSLTDGFVNFQENFYKLFRWSFSSLLILSSTTTKLL